MFLGIVTSKTYHTLLLIRFSEKFRIIIGNLTLRQIRLL